MPSVFVQYAIKKNRVPSFCKRIIYCPMHAVATLARGSTDVSSDATAISQQLQTSLPRGSSRFGTLVAIVVRPRPRRGERGSNKSSATTLLGQVQWFYDRSNNAEHEFNTVVSLTQEKVIQGRAGGNTHQLHYPIDGAVVLVTQALHALEAENKTHQSLARSPIK